MTYRLVSENVFLSKFEVQIVLIYEFIYWISQWRSHDYKRAWAKFYPQVHDSEH
jgi:hypothetical protein